MGKGQRILNENEGEEDYEKIIKGAKIETIVGGERWW